MDMRAGVRQAWEGFWTLHQDRAEPAWARVLIAGALSFAASFALVMLAGLLRLSWFEPAWWRNLAIPMVCVGVTMGITLLCVFRAFELAARPATLAQLQADAGWRSGLTLNALAATGMLLGCAIGMALVQSLYNGAAWIDLALPRQRIHLVLFILVLVAANAVAWAVRARQQVQRRADTEAQLRLLQAQIEPQFLFNTLADVQGLLDCDPERARQMLEEFTDYLRASIGQLRRADTTLAAELDMAQCYLQLLQLKMGERLRFSVEASVQARRAVVPPLLVQPLVENAVRHGLDPMAGGGSVHLHAGVRDGRLEVSVQDDGVGLPATPARTGHALNNIRARLQSRYGATASLTLASHRPGTRATIGLPFVGAAVDSSQGARP
jgi:glucose-6-phosphate-specific signal transduction histidine kinase